MTKKLFILTAILLIGFSKSAKADFELIVTQNTPCTFNYTILDASFTGFYTGNIAGGLPPTCITTVFIPAYVRFIHPCTGVLTTLAVNTSDNGCLPGDPCLYFKNVTFAPSSGCGGYTLQINF